MKKRFVRTRFGEIAVRESEGDSPPILLVHEHTLGAESFWRQIAGDPGRRFRMISFDFPGHGDSPRAADPRKNYTVSGCMSVLKDLAAVLDLREPVLVGHGTGAHILLQTVAAGWKPRGMVLIGAPPLSGPSDFPAAFLPEGFGGLLFHAALPEEQKTVCAQLFFSPGVPVPPYFRRSIGSTDPAAREIMGASILGESFADEMALLGSLDVPVAVLIGEHDRIVNADYVRGIRFPGLWKGSVQVIRGAGHCPQYEAPLAFNAALLDFLSDTLERADFPLHPAFTAVQRQAVTG